MFIVEEMVCFYMKVIQYQNIIHTDILSMKVSLIIIVYIYIAHNNQKDSLCALHNFIQLHLFERYA